MRHATRQGTAAPDPAAATTQRIAMQPVAAEPATPEPATPEPSTTEPVTTEPITTEPVTTELPAPLAAPAAATPPPATDPDREWKPAASWTISPVSLPPAGAGRTVRILTSKRVKTPKAPRTAGERKAAATMLRRRGVASVAIASLVAGGMSYFVTESITPAATTVPPPQAAPQPSMEADVWAGQAEVVLASINQQLDVVAQTEANLLQLPEPGRVQPADAVKALQDHKVLLEQQRATLMSQLDALRALPELTTELSAAQAHLDAVERTLEETPTGTSSPDHEEAVRQLEEQRELRRQQRDRTVQALADMRDGVEEALSRPLPDKSDRTTPVVEKVRALIEDKPDSDDDNDESQAADGQDSVANQRRDDEDDERSDVGVTAPPDPERPNVAAVLAGGGSESGADRESPASEERASQARADRDGDGEQAGPVRGITGTLGDTVGSVLPGDDDDDRSESRERSERADDERSDWFADRDNDDRSDWLSNRDNDDRTGWLSNRDNDDEGDRSGWLSNGDGDDEDRSGWASDRRSDRDGDDDPDADDDVAQGVGDITDGLLGGSDDDRERADREDRDDPDGSASERRPSGKAERNRSQDVVERPDNSDGDEEQAEQGGDERKKPSGKAERTREKAREAAERLTDGDRDDEKADERESDRSDEADEDESDKKADKDESDNESDDKGDKGDKGDSANESDNESDDEGDKDKSDDKSDDGDDESDSDSGGSDSEGSSDD